MCLSMPSLGKVGKHLLHKVPVPELLCAKPVCHHTGFAHKCYVYLVHIGLYINMVANVYAWDLAQREYHFMHVIFISCMKFSFHA